MKRMWAAPAFAVLCIAVQMVVVNPAVGQTQIQMDAAAGHAWKEADAALSTFYRSYAKLLAPDQLPLFKAANSAWMGYRKAYCQFQSSMVAGGSAYPMVRAYCMAEQATSRLRLLRSELVSRCRMEGDLSCPVVVPEGSMPPVPTGPADPRH